MQRREIPPLPLTSAPSPGRGGDESFILEKGDSIMKKLLISLLIPLLVLSVAVPAFASELPKESKDFSVEYTNRCNGVSVPVSDGKASGILPDGAPFSAEKLPDNAATLRVYPVQPDEKEVKKWVEDCLEKGFDGPVVYDVVCLDADGNEISNKGAKVTVNAPEANDAITVCAVDGAGKAIALDAVERDGKITFVTTGARLYALCVASKNPATADRSVALFAVAALLSAALSLRFVKGRKA